MLLSGSYIGVSAENNTSNGSDNNTKPCRWAISAGFGQTTLDDETPDGQDFYLNDGLGNTFYVRGDYYLSDRFALTGGWYLESDGMMTDAADGIGYKHINLSGLEGGIKFYFFPKKWIVQPHIGAMVQTNFFNLDTEKGTGYYTADQACPGSKFKMDWDVIMSGCIGFTSNRR